jgi:hypothetical protein
MKKLLSLLLLSFLVFASCNKNKDEINNTDDNVGSSRVTRFPTFTMNGSKYLSLVRGSAYTEAGVTAKEGTTDLQVQTSGSVNTNVVGVYNITYSAINKDGFPGTVTRTVAVLPSAEQAGVNIAGSYQNVGSFAYTATMEKLAPGFYVVDNVWGGSSAAVIPGYIITVDGQNIIVPTSSLSPYGRITGTGTLDAAGNLTYVISLLDQGVSNSTRKWKKI